MQTKVTIIIAFLSLTAGSLTAQFSGGFVAGMNFSKLSGPSETDAAGNNLEENTFKTGFHVGGRFSYKFTEAFGLRGEVLYSQKGSDFKYDGESYFVFLTEDEDLIFSTGTRNTNLRIVNSYVEIPAMAFLRLGRLEIGGGGYFAYLFRSTATGNLNYRGVSASGSTIEPFDISLDFNYFTDGFERTDIGETQPVIVDGEVVQVPTVIGSQYEVLVEPEDRLFQRTDFGLIGNLAVYLNQGLFLGFRVNYGLVDLTKTERDISRKMLDENNRPIFRDDFDRNLTLQASIGFGF